MGFAGIDRSVEPSLLGETPGPLFTRAQFDEAVRRARDEHGAIHGSKRHPHLYPPIGPKTCIYCGENFDTSHGRQR